MKTDTQTIDWQCGQCDKHGIRWTDGIQNKHFRKLRYQEFCGLKSLPFLSDEQNKRLEKLKSLRRYDNLMSFKGVNIS